MTEAEIIEQAEKLCEEPVITLLAALETFCGNGVTDEVSGDVESPSGHFYRVDRWLVATDSQGFRDVSEYPTVEDAKRAFEESDVRYSRWVES